MDLTIYIEDLHGQEAIDVTNEIENALGIFVIDVYDIGGNNTEITIEGDSYRDGEDVEAMLRSMGYVAVFDR